MERPAADCFRGRDGCLVHFIDSEIMRGPQVELAMDTRPHLGGDGRCSGDERHFVFALDFGE